MEKNQFQQFAEQLTEDVQPEDIQADVSTTTPILRIHQSNTQSAPETSKPGWFYSPNAGFIEPAETMTITILDVRNICQLWTPWGKQDKHIVCRCLQSGRAANKSNQGRGIPFVEDEHGRWFPGEEERECSACSYNPFRIQSLEPLPEFELSGKLMFAGGNSMCSSGKIFIGFFVPEEDGVEISLNTVMPLVFQAGSSMFSSAYTRLLDSWETFEISRQMAKQSRTGRPLPWYVFKLEVGTVEVETPNGIVFCPTFTPVGIHVEALENMRALSYTYRNRPAIVGAAADMDGLE